MKIPHGFTLERLISLCKWDGGCLVFGGAKNHAGYGRIQWKEDGKAREVLAHRLMWYFVYGDPGELCVLHKCDNPPCVSDQHLFEGTRAINNIDCRSKGRNKNPPGRAILTRGEVAWVRRILNTGKLTYQSVGKMFGVSTSAIGEIARGKNWRSHVGSSA